MLIKILIVATVIAVIVVISVIVKHKREAAQRMYHAAGNILKNEFLDYSLHNPWTSDAAKLMPNGRKSMICFKLRGSKPAKEYVFDPEKVVKIGRSKESNSIALSEAIVSVEHCKVYLSGELIILEDCGSSNGTVVKRKWHTYTIGSGQAVTLCSGDVIIVGSTELKVKIFYYDMVWM